MKNLISYCFLSFLNSLINSRLLWASPFSSLPMALKALQLEWGGQSGLVASHSLCCLLPGAPAVSQEAEVWDGFQCLLSSRPTCTMLNRMAPGFPPCGRHAFLCWSSLPAKLLLFKFFSGSFQRKSGVQEVKQLVPMPFYPGVCKKHSLTFFILWEHIPYAINLLKTTLVFVGRGTEM